MYSQLILTGSLTPNLFIYQTCKTILTLNGKEPVKNSINFPKAKDLRKFAQSYISSILILIQSISSKLSNLINFKLSESYENGRKPLLLASFIGKNTTF